MLHLRYEQDTLNAQFCVIGCCCCYCSSCCCSKIAHLRCEPGPIIGVTPIMAPGASKIPRSHNLVSSVVVIVLVVAVARYSN